MHTRARRSLFRVGDHQMRMERHDPLLQQLLELGVPIVSVSLSLWLWVKFPVGQSLHMNYPLCPWAGHFFFFFFCSPTGGIGHNVNGWKMHMKSWMDVQANKSLISAEALWMSKQNERSQHLWDGLKSKKKKKMQLSLRENVRKLPQNRTCTQFTNATQDCAWTSVCFLSMNQIFNAQRWPVAHS